MNRLQKAAVLTQLAEALRSRGSWCGETHLQKAVYFLQCFLGVPLGVEYLLYKHGPYSFDLTEMLTSLRADYLLEKQFKAGGYGPSLSPTQASAELRQRHPHTLAKYGKQIEFIAQSLGSKGVTDLEKLATAFYVTRELGKEAPLGLRAERLNQLKPHISIDMASQAIEELDHLMIQASDYVMATEKA